LLFRDNAGGTYANSIFMDFADKAISIEDLAPGEGDAHQNLMNGDLNLLNNFWFDFGAGSDLADIVDTYSSGDDPDASDVIDHLGNNGNVLTNPEVCKISRIPDGGLNPRLSGTSPALSGATPSTDAFFDAVTYHGAFNGGTNWAHNWSALSQYGHMSNQCDFTSSTNNIAGKNGFILNQNTPNPAISNTTFEFIIPTKSEVVIEVYDINGRLMNTLVNDEFLEGKYTIDLNVSDLANGTYFVSLKSNTVVLTQKMTVLK